MDQLAYKQDLDSLKKGSRVEVDLPDNGFLGSFYTGTVVRGVSRRTRKLTVRFDKLHEEKKPNKKLRQEVEFIYVRPIPPREAARTFRVDDDVDAEYNDGWWEGVVLRVLPPSPPPESQNDAAAAGGEATYEVYFKDKKSRLFKASQLRLHREWVRGVWVPPLEADVAGAGASASASASPSPSPSASASASASASVPVPVQADAEANMNPEK